MILQRLSAVNYRNLKQVELYFSPNVNCFVGANGMGKSNVLDAIYYLSFCRGFVNTQDAVNLRHEADFFMLEGDYCQDNGVEQRVRCGLKAGTRKRLKINGESVRRLSEHLGKIPLVIIAPSDSALITGGSEDRRNFIDSVVSQYATPYLEALMRYDRALKQRNALLKQETEPIDGVFDVLEDMMDEAGAVIYKYRKRFVEEFLPTFREIYSRLAGEANEEVDIVYASHGERGSLAPQLRSSRTKERIVGYTLHGMHKDDLRLLLNGFPIKNEGSQGQTKTYFIAMKLAQYVFLKGKGENRTPLLLLDDIFDKLDAHRVAHIVDYAGGNEFGQIFITDTRRDHLDCILAATKRDYRLFEVANGEVTPVHQ